MLLCILRMQTFVLHSRENLAAVQPHSYRAHGRGCAGAMGRLSQSQDAVGMEISLPEVPV